MLTTQKSQLTKQIKPAWVNFNHSWQLPAYVCLFLGKKIVHFLFQSTNLSTKEWTSALIMNVWHMLLFWSVNSAPLTSSCEGCGRMWVKVGSASAKTTVYSDAPMCSESHFKPLQVSICSLQPWTNTFSASARWRKFRLDLDFKVVSLFRGQTCLSDERCTTSSEGLGTIKKKC